MERHFRKYTFLVDWCYFRLLTRSSSGDEQGKTTKDQAGNIIKNERTEGDESDTLKSQASLPSEPEVFQFRSVIPVRGYGVETLIATIIPGTIKSTEAVVSNECFNLSFNFVQAQSVD
jgi:hypothetical protein